MVSPNPHAVAPSLEFRHDTPESFGTKEECVDIRPGRALALQFTEKASLDHSSPFSIVCSVLTEARGGMGSPGTEGRECP